MRMEGQDESQNVEDARGSGGFRPIHGIGLGTIALAAGRRIAIAEEHQFRLLVGGTALAKHIRPNLFRAAQDL